ncbi:hypothetical protein IGI04_012614 [Brassica rapa subsp. trilocularis]|uniref:Uncharacterized protein n=1 Tax=Brassica rapa subsp. trilocularis TaxID=1813537 RepID=A0ABQ7N8T4_BRACM|nr:hypothetical protein IGI04_012614 [Brassica rapa subsp. trilocularis]
MVSKHCFYVLALLLVFRYYHLNYLRVVVMFYVVTPTLCIFFLFVAYTGRMKSHSICVNLNLV